MKRSKEVDQILTLMSELDKKITVDDDLNYISDMEYNEIVKKIKSLTISIYNHKLNSIGSEERLEELTEMMTAMGLLDFSKKATVTNQRNHLDYVAIGLNIMSYQLNKSITAIKIYQDVFESISMSLIVTDISGKIQTVNRAAEILSGYEREILQKKHIGNVLKNEFPPNKGWNYSETDLMHRNTNPIAVEVIITELKNNHELNGFIYLFRVKNSMRLETSHFDLNRIHHDLNHPLNTMQGLINLGKDTSSDAELFELLEKCKVAVESYVNDILDILNNRKNDEKPEWIAPEILVKNIISQLSGYENFKRIKFVVNKQNEKALRCNKKLLISVLQNLLSNSVKYSNSEVTSFVEVSFSDYDKGIVIRIQDNGIGIAAEKISEIFKAHYRATEQGEGQGMGLFIVKEAVIRLNGEISVESVLGKSTIFAVKIPSVE